MGGITEQLYWLSASQPIDQIMSNFYLTLPSNSSMSYYEDNTLASFTTRLPNTIDLEGDWEVGLVEIQYPHNWFNVPSEVTARSFRMRGRRDGRAEDRRFIIRDGYYPSVRSLLDEIENKGNNAANSTNMVDLHFDTVTQKVSQVNINLPDTVDVPAHIQQMLGMNNSYFTRDSRVTDSVVNMNPLDSLYVYCDVVEPRVVGDSLTPLLRIVPVEGEHGELVTRIYTNVHYVRVQRKTFQTLEVNIRDRTGKKVPFERGTLNVTLHFRRSKRFSTL